MERLVIQYPVLTVLIWVLLNLLHYYFIFLNHRLYKSWVSLDPKFAIKYDKKYFLKLLLWVGFGVGFLSVYKQGISQGAATTEEYFVVVGAFYFLLIGHLLRDILSIVGYFAYRKEIPRATYLFKPSIIMSSFEFLGYSALMLLSFLISKNSFLLGGTLGLAFGGGLYITRLERYVPPR